MCIRDRQGIVRYPWSPCVWKDGDKRIANFLHADFIALDFDTPELPLAQAVNVFCDYIHVIGTTKSHQKDKGGIVCDRYRVVLRLGGRVESAEAFSATLGHAMRHYPADKACKDAGRFFWPCSEIVSVNDDGFTADVMEPEPEKEPALSTFDEAGCLPRSAVRLGYEDLRELGLPVHVTVFNVGRDLGAAGFTLELALKYLRDGPTWKIKERRKEFERTIRDGHSIGAQKRHELMHLFKSDAGR
jgi:hypothetical protein